MHDGIHPHIYGPVKECLDRNFRNDWIERSGPLARPPNSPDLNPTDFYLWDTSNLLSIK